MFARVGESVVIGVARFPIGGDAVAPRQLVSFRRGGNGGFAVALVALDLGENVQRVGVECRKWATFGDIPNLFEQFPSNGEFVLAAVEFSERCEGGKFFFDATDCSCAVSACWGRSVAVFRSFRPRAAVP